MTRFERVHAEILKERSKPYVVGEADCFLLAMAVASALTGADHRSEYEGIYSTYAGATKQLRKRGAKTLCEFFRTLFDETPVLMAQVGDIGVVNVDNGQHAAVCTGNSFLCKTENGERYFRYDQVVSAFSVPDQ